MTNPSWKDIAELTGIAAIVASLVFVGVQIRQEAAATRSAAVLQLKDSWVQLNLAQATNLDLARAFEVVHKNGLESDAQARAMVEGFYRTLFHNWSNAYYQYRIGTLEEEQWIPHVREMESAANNVLITSVWNEWNYVFDDEFRKLMIETLSTSKTDTSATKHGQGSAQGIDKP